MSVIGDWDELFQAQEEQYELMSEELVETGMI
jgi:hypothetical protein